MRYFAFAVFLFASCESEGPETAASADDKPLFGSRELAANFPLLPVIEKTLWRQLLAAEAASEDSVEPAERETAGKEVVRLIALLRGRHPFEVDGGRMELGGIVHDGSHGRITIPARVEYPNPGDERHPNEVELLLCTMAGRMHETLFVTDVRPLHLELLLHLAGHTKGEAGNRFRIEAINNEGDRIPVESLVRASDGGVLAHPMLWEFSGSDYQDVYPPDLSGDFAIFWHAHDSVLRVDHEGIAIGEVKLLPLPHPKLPHGASVVLELIPETK
jgi:hypothetical protein